MDDPCAFPNVDSEGEPMEAPSPPRARQETTACAPPKRARVESAAAPDAAPAAESDPMDGYAEEDEELALDERAASEQDARKALAALMRAAPGRPVPSEEWKADAPRLRVLPPRALLPDSVLTALYWVRADAPTLAAIAAASTPKRKRDALVGWAKAQPWFAQLTVQPHASSSSPVGPRPFHVWYAEPSRGMIGVPRFFGLSAFGPPALDARVLGAPMLAAARVVDTTRPHTEHQRDCIEASLASLREWGGAFVTADCGFGKTAIALAIAAALGRKTLVLLNRGVLMQQWRDVVRGKVWTWGDNGAPLDPSCVPARLEGVPPVDWMRARCRACKAYTHTSSLAHAPPAACACGGAFATYTQRRRDGPTSLAGAADAPVAPEDLDEQVLWAPSVEPVRAWLPGARVGWMQGPYKPDKKRRDPAAVLAHHGDTVPSDLDADIVVASIQSLIACKYPAALLAQFGTVIVDEAHCIGARSLSQALPCLPARYVLAISATPARRDGLEHALYWLGGPASYVYKRLVSVTGKSGTVEVRVQRYEGGAQQEIFQHRSLAFARMMMALATDARRTAFVARKVRELLAEGCRKVLVVSTFVEHLYALSDACADAVPPHARYILHGGTPDVVVSASKSGAARLVFATMQLLSEGFDDSRIDGLVLALPRSSVQQIIGRVERWHEGKRRPIVVDILDDFSVFGKMVFKRLRFARSRGFIVRSSEGVAAPL